MQLTKGFKIVAGTAVVAGVAAYIGTTQTLLWNKTDRLQKEIEHMPAVVVVTKEVSPTPTATPAARFRITAKPTIFYPTALQKR